MAYQSIENYGIIGEMHTAALVGMDGSMNWFCYPQLKQKSKDFHDLKSLPPHS